MGSTTSPSQSASDSAAAGASAGTGHDNTAINDTATSAGAAASLMRVNDAAAPDGPCSGDAADSSPSVDLAPSRSQDDDHVQVGKAVEYRWPNNMRWYRCNVFSISPGKNGQGRVLELAYLPPKNSKTTRVKVYTERLELAKLLEDGDIAKPGEHLEW